MSAFTCPQKDEDGTICGARLELTRKTYLHFDPDTGDVADDALGHSWSLYCADDHNLGDDFDDLDAVRLFIATYNS